MQRMRFLATTRALWITGLGTLGLLVFFNLYQRQAGLPASAITDFELAWSKGRTLELFNQWGAAGVDAIRVVVIIDTLLFIPLYTSWGSGVLQRLRAPGWLAALPLLAGVFDYVENACEFGLLYAFDATPAWAVPVESTCASIKFGLLAIALAAAPILWWRKRRMR